MRLRVGDLPPRLEVRDAQIKRLRVDVADEAARYQNRSDVEVALPVSGRVWEVLTAPGEHVSRGQDLLRLLDCSSAVVTANVSESVYNRLQVGSPVTFRPSSGGEDYAGTIVNLTGIAGAPANFAILPSTLVKEAYHVTVAVPAIAEGDECGVGRTGRVIFEKGAAEAFRHHGRSERPRAAAVTKVGSAELLSALWPTLVLLGASLVAMAIANRSAAATRFRDDGGQRIAVDSLLLLARVVDAAARRAVKLDFTVGALFLFIETTGLVAAILCMVFLSRSRDRTPDVERNKPWLEALAEKPLIDVLICTYNEEEAILERTIIGATGMDYPNYRVWVLDDGNRPWLQALCEELGCGYVARPDNRHAKAGNINYAPGQIAQLPKPPQFISILDADFVPMPDFLSRAMTLFPRREGRHRPDAAAFHQSRSDPDQSPGDAGLAGRTALFLRCRDAGQGRLVRRLLLRHVLGHPVSRPCRNRRISDQFRHRGLSADAAHEGGGLHAPSISTSR